MKPQTRFEIIEDIAKCLIHFGSYKFDTTRETMRGTDRLRYEARPHYNPALSNTIVYTVTALEQPNGNRCFDSAVNKSFDTREQFVAAIMRRQKASKK